MECDPLLSLARALPFGLADGPPKSRTSSSGWLEARPEMWLAPIDTRNRGGDGRHVARRPQTSPVARALNRPAGASILRHGVTRRKKYCGGRLAILRWVHARADAAGGGGVIVGARQEPLAALCLALADAERREAAERERHTRAAGGYRQYAAHTVKLLIAERKALLDNIGREAVLLAKAPAPPPPKSSRSSASNAAELGDGSTPTSTEAGGVDVRARTEKPSEQRRPRTRR